MPRNHSLLEAFGERIDWMIRCLDPDPAFGRIRNRAELWRAIESRVSVSERSWKRCVSPNKDHAVHPSVVSALCHVYHALDYAVLTLPTFAAFRSSLEHRLQAAERWTQASRYLASNRAELALLGKRYHHAVDETPQSPLIGRSEWLLSEPSEITRATPLPNFDWRVPDVEAPRLEGLPLDYSALKMRLTRNPNSFNGDCFRMLAIEGDGRRLGYTFGRGKYFSYINSCEALGAELADFAIRHEAEAAAVLSDPERPFPCHLPFRGEPADIFNFHGRSTFPGVNCLLMMKGYYRGVFSELRGRTRRKFALHHRGDATLEAQNTVHVVPAGGHQPLAADFGDEGEVSIWATVVREFCEELFDKEEAARLRSLGEAFLEHESVRELVHVFFESGAARIYELGVGLDPVTTKPEILVAVVVDWHKASIQSDRLRIEPNYEGRVVLIDLSKERLAFEAQRADVNFLPAGKACLLQAARHYDYLMNSGAPT